MAERRQILEFCDELLSIADFEDYGPNGLQVPGAEQVSRIATGVTANLELLRRAVDSGAELILIHHGLLWGDEVSPLSVPMASRLRALLCANVSLAAYHLPLDAHPGIGNNALLRERLGLEAERQEFGMAKGRAIGVVGRAPQPLAISELRERLGSATGQEPLVFDAGPERVRTIGIVSGAGAGSLPEAVERGLDALLTGEPREHVMADAREEGIHFIAAGHYATETFGVRALGDRLERELGVEHVFVDVPNPV